MEAISFLFALFAMICSVAIYLWLVAYFIVTELNGGKWQYGTKHLLVAMFVVSVLFGMYHYINR